MGPMPVTLNDLGRQSPVTSFSLIICGAFYKISTHSAHAVPLCLLSFLLLKLMYIIINSSAVIENAQVCYSVCLERYTGNLRKKVQQYRLLGFFS